MGEHLAIITHFLVFLQDSGAVVGPIFPKPLAQLIAAAMASPGRPAAHRLKSHCLGAAAAALVEGHLRDGHQLLLWSAAWTEVPTSSKLCVRVLQTQCQASCSENRHGCLCIESTALLQ